MRKRLFAIALVFGLAIPAFAVTTWYVRLKCLPDDTEIPWHYDRALQTTLDPTIGCSLHAESTTSYFTIERIVP